MEGKRDAAIWSSSPYLVHKILIDGCCSIFIAQNVFLFLFSHVRTSLGFVIHCQEVTSHFIVSIN